MTETLRLDSLVTYLRSTANNKVFDIDLARNLLTDAANTLEKIFNELDIETECPCCTERIYCVNECTFYRDAPDEYERMQFMRELLAYNV